MLRVDISMFNINEYKKKIIDVEQYLSLFNNGTTVFIHTGAGEPVFLVDLLGKLDLDDLDIFQLYSIRSGENSKKKLFQTYKFKHFFVSEEFRKATNYGLVDYIPINLSLIPSLFNLHRIHIDVALIQTSLPDNNGFLSLGTNIDITLAAVKNAVKVVAQINPNMPRTMGNSFVHINEIDYIIEREEELLEVREPDISERALRAAENASTLVVNEDTLQIGYGKTSQAVLRFLYGKKGLGIHSEIFYDELIDLVRENVITSKYKTINKNRITVSFVHGGKRSYDFINNNPFVQFYPVDYTNNPLVILKHKKMVSINSALEVDLLGQVNAESLSYRMYTGVGGFLDFNFGTIYSETGKSIIVMPSLTSDEKKSRIVSEIKEGYGVTLSKANVHYIVTEFGLAYLFGKTLRERALALISVAHPDYREELYEYARNKGILPSDQIFPLYGSNYPNQYETTFITKTGKELLVRPLKSDDEDKLRSLLYSYSADKLYQRFFCFIKDFRHEKTQCMVNINYEFDMALGCFYGNSEELIATAGYFYDSAEHTGEVAFMVKPDFCKEGIATFLHNYLIKIGKERGLRGFKAYVLRTNKPMLSIFYKSGYHINSKSSLDINIFELDLLFDYK